jgi:hypothetical protein
MEKGAGGGNPVAAESVRRSNEGERILCVFVRVAVKGD